MTESTKNVTIEDYYITQNVRMRAKFEVVRVDTFRCEDKETVVSEQINMRAVGAKEYGKDGENEDNDFARFTPFGELVMGINNPNLFGTMKEGDTYYLDFTKCE